MRILLLLLVVPTIAGPPVFDAASDEPLSKKARFFEPRCRLMFSEVALKSGIEGTAFPFIELKAECKNGRPGPVPLNVLAGYKMYFLQLKPLSVVTIIDFDLHVFSDFGQIKYIVISSPKLENVDIPLTSDKVQTVFSKFNHFEMLPNPFEAKYSVVITHGVAKAVSKRFHLQINSAGKLLPKLLSQSDFQILKACAVDMINLFDDQGLSSNAFTDIWNYRSSKQPYFGAWEEIAKTNSDISLSMCSEQYLGFDAGVFKKSRRTPAQPNSCEDTEFHSNKQNDPNYVAPLEKQCSIKDDSFSHDGKQVHFFPFEKLIDVKKKTFNQIWTQTCSPFFPTREKLLEKSSIIDWIFFKTEDTSCRFHCKVCNLYYSVGFRPDVKKKPDIVKAGYISKDKYENSDQVKRHEKNEIHTVALKFYNELSKAENQDSVDKIIKTFENEEKFLFNSTMNVVVVVYTEVKAGIALSKHEEIMKSLRLIGANVGWHHHNPVAAQYINHIISKTFHHNLLSHLVRERNYFSIIVDGSTIIREAYLIIYIQTTEDSYPVTHFYSVLHLTHGEKGKEMADALISQIKSDDAIVPGFEELFKQYLATITSDGASNMVGIHNSFKTHLSVYADRIIPNIECLAHKLDNAIKFGLKVKATDGSESQDYLTSLRYLESFEKKTNDFYKFYASRGHKKWLHLIKTAEELNMTPKTLKYFFEIRWSESHFNALDTLRHDYPALVEDLLKIQTSSEFVTSARDSAKLLHATITDISYVITLHEFLDLLQVFRIASKQFQQGSAIIIGKVEIVHKVIQQFTILKISPGSYLSNFLKQCQCKIPNLSGSMSLSMYDSCKSVSYDGVLLTHKIESPVKLSLYRINLYENLIEAVKKYFKLPLLEGFEIFNPATFNMIGTGTAIGVELLYQRNSGLAITSTTPTIISQTERIETICKFYVLKNEECQQYKQEWNPLLKCLTQNDNIRDHMTLDASKFWPHALETCTIYWTPLIRKVIGLVLSTPFSSAECERGFSVINRIKTKERSRMDKETLNELARVKINGPNIEDFDPYESTVNFLKEYARVDDLKNNGGKKPDQKNLILFFEKAEYTEILY